MKFAVMASGAVGAYVGARLVEAGHDVSFIARGQHLKAMKENGLSIKSDKGDFFLKNVNVCEYPSEIGKVETIIFAVKLWDTVLAAKAMLPMVGFNTNILTLQNGVESVEMISSVVSSRQILGGTIFIASEISEPGVITQFGNKTKITLGELDLKNSKRSQKLKNIFEKTNIEATVTNQILTAIWEKYIALVAISGSTCLTRLPIRTLMEEKTTATLIEDLMEEVISLAKAKGIEISKNVIARHKEFFQNASPKMTSSMLQDLEKENRLELQWLSGGVVRMANKIKLPVPINQTVLAAIKLYENGAPKLVT